MFIKALNKSAKILLILLIILILIISISLINLKIIQSDETPVIEVLSSNKEMKNDKLIEGNKKALEESIKFQNIIRSIVDSTLPAIVSIKSEIEKEDKGISEYIGSGIIISEDGYILTNEHLISNAKNIYINLYNDTKNYKARLIGSRKDSDMAILKIKTKQKLFSAYIGDSDTVRAGDFSFAVGNPFGLKGSVTFGIVSAVNRNLSALNLIKKDNKRNDNIYYIQTDAEINTGNSGGALVNIKGQVIGINTVIFSDARGINLGIGFAIPINYAKKIALDILNNKPSKNVFLGIIGGEEIITDKEHRFYSEEGIIVASVYKDSPASNAGIKQNDLIISIDNKDINTIGDFRRIIQSYKPEQKVNIKVKRDNTIIRIKTELANKEKWNDKRYKTSNFLGIIIENIDDDLYKDMNIKGVRVIGIEKNSPASDSPISPGDIINAVDYNEITSVSSYDKIIKNLNQKKARYVFTVKRITNTGNIIQETLYIENR